MTTKHEILESFHPRGGRLARRARSFKDDILVKLNQIRSPSGTRSPKSKKKGMKVSSNNGTTNGEMENHKDLQNLHQSVKLLNNALGYLKDVVEKDKLEMLAGSASVVLEIIVSIHTDLKNCLTNEQSSLQQSASSQLYQSVAALLQWSDQVQLYPERQVDRESVQALITGVQDAIQTLVSLALDILNNKPNGVHSNNTSPQKNNIIDIMSSNFVHDASPFPHSASTDSALSTPPPKPPLPLARTLTTGEAIPPLPPKQQRGLLGPARSQELTVDWTASGSGRSSGSSSLDSSLNHSADDILAFNSSSAGLLQSSMDSVDQILLEEEEAPPALPAKQRQRTPSHYDNVPLLLHVPEVEEQPQQHTFTCPKANHHHSWSHAPSCPRRHLIETSSHNTSLMTSSDAAPPPLPPKQKNVMAYMQMFGSYSQPAEGEFFRHSFHTYHHVLYWQHQLVSHDTDLLLTSTSFTATSNSSCEAITTPPALPPKKNKIINQVTSTPTSPVLSLSPPSINTMATNGSSLYDRIVDKAEVLTEDEEEDDEQEEEVAAIQPYVGDPSPLDELEVSKYLVFKKPEEDGPTIRGGHVDALIVHATKVSKNDFLYQEAFLTTYRTFISPLELIQKLLYRYNRLANGPDIRAVRAARNAFALLVRVVDDLCTCDVGEVTLQLLMEFTYRLVNQGELVLARALRKVVCDKCDLWHTHRNSTAVLLPSMAISARVPSSLLAFKTEQLAEQMTLLDSHLFLKIEIPEVLLWAKEQKEELSPNLTTFTEHFNKMSYWTRSCILEQEESRDRERHVVKFIKIMKHLRKLNNFNSYLAILSALDSAPIRRLDWNKTITESLKEYGSLIDSSSSFRAYRQALAEAESPCIPYIGLILQDLTFVHIGNADHLPDGQINFSKRWQAFNILENMRRFRNCQYPFKRNELIMSFFNNFDNYLCEEALWQLSETIKPRASRK